MHDMPHWHRFRNNLRLIDSGAGEGGSGDPATGDPADTGEDMAGSTGTGDDTDTGTLDDESGDRSRARQLLDEAEAYFVKADEALKASDLAAYQEAMTNAEEKVAEAAKALDN